jgi:creatinine amidohydrolase
LKSLLRRAWPAALGAWLLPLVPAVALAAPPLQIDALTSPELRERVATGSTTVLLPVGGTEQNGAHLALGKHNQRAALLAARIAERLGGTLVAPVLAYVPEGAIDPPGGHMRYAGTLSVPDAAFEAVLAGAARSLCHHGFRHVVLLGDHGGYQAHLARVAARFPAAGGCHVHALHEYYRAAQEGFPVTLRARGFAPAEIGTHAGLADTALTLALDPSLVRGERLGRPPRPGERDGVQGDPRRATV